MWSRNPLTGLSGLQRYYSMARTSWGVTGRNPLTGLSVCNAGETGQTRGATCRNPLTGLSGLQHLVEVLK